jgi:hypothetical protein
MFLHVFNLCNILSEGNVVHSALWHNLKALLKVNL